MHCIQVGGLFLGFCCCDIVAGEVICMLCWWCSGFSKMHVMGGCNCSLAFVAVTLQERQSCGGWWC
jgi:hypothetical protein